MVNNENMKKKFVNDTAVKVCFVCGLLSCAFMVISKIILIDDYTVSTMPLAEVVMIPLLIALYYAYKNRKFKFLFGLVLAVISVSAIWPIYFIWMVFLPYVVTFMTQGVTTGYIIIGVISIIYLIFIFSVYVRTCSGKSNISLISLKSKLNIVFNVFLVIVVFGITITLSTLDYYSQTAKIMLDVVLYENMYAIALCSAMGFSLSFASYMLTYMHFINKVITVKAP